MWKEGADITWSLEPALNNFEIGVACAVKINQKLTQEKIRKETKKSQKKKKKKQSSLNTH